MAVEATLVLLMLLGASWSDLQTRRVANRYWFPFIVCAGILWIPRLFALDVGLLLGAGAMTAVAYGMWWIGTFGGADAKGLMVFAWLWPGVPDLLAGQTLPVLDTLVNGALLMMAYPLLFLVLNLVRGHIAVPAMVLGLQMEREAARRQHVWPMQEMRDGKLHWRFWQRPAAALAPTYAALATAGIERVWTTPKVPFMVPLAAGALIAATWGNIVLRLLL